MKQHMGRLPDGTEVLVTLWESEDGDAMGRTGEVALRSPAGGSWSPPAVLTEVSEHGDRKDA